jgi:hypothetical protein
MCYREVPERHTFLEEDGDRMCVYDWRCAAIAMRRLGIDPHAAERLARRMYEADEVAA